VSGGPLHPRKPPLGYAGPGLPLRALRRHSSFLEAAIGPPTYRLARDDLVAQMRGALDHALAGKRHRLLMVTLGAAQPHKAVGQDADFSKEIDEQLAAVVHWINI
jgi:hypothetical protein